MPKKKFTEKQFINFHRELKFFFASKNIYFNDVQYCPYHQKALIKKYRKKSTLRKPNNGMIKKIEKKFLLDKKNSFSIGDKLSDKLAFNSSKLLFEYAKKNLYNQIINILKNKLNKRVY